MYIFGQINLCFRSIFQSSNYQENNRKCNLLLLLVLNIYNEINKIKIKLALYWNYSCVEGFVSYSLILFPLLCPLLGRSNYFHSISSLSIISAPPRGFIAKVSLVASCKPRPLTLKWVIVNLISESLRRTLSVEGRKNCLIRNKIQASTWRGKVWAPATASNKTLYYLLYRI